MITKKMIASFIWFIDDESPFNLFLCVYVYIGLDWKYRGDSSMFWHLREVCFYFRQRFVESLKHYLQGIFILRF